MKNFFTQDYFDYKFPQPQYLGAKQKHLTWIGTFVPKDIKTILDPFSGSQSVSYYFKQLGKQVIANDFLNFNNQIGKALIENNNAVLTDEDITILFAENTNPNYYNLFENVYSGLFFTESDCRLIDSIRSNIERLQGYKKNLAFAVMNRTLTRKTTMGHFGHTMALKYAMDSERIKRNRSLIRPIKDIFLDLVVPYNNAVFDNGQDNISHCGDAIAAIKNSNNIDLLYLDPPYCCSHADYQSFYHLLETFTEYWKDKTFINSTKMYSPKKYSGFDLKSDALKSFEKLFQTGIDIPYWLISYNNRSFPKQEHLLEIISKYKKVKIYAKQYMDSVGGKGSVKGSHELLFVCSPKSKEE